MKHPSSSGAGSMEGLLNRALEALEAGRQKEAFDGFTRALERDERCVEAWHGRGEILLRREEFAHAGGQFEQALRLDPGHAPSHFHFAQALFQFGLVEKALEHLDRVAGQTNGQSELLAAMYAPGSTTATPADILNRRRAYADTLTPLPEIDEGAGRRRTGPIRVGYLSAHFDQRNYMKPVWGLVNEHDRKMFELTFFSDATGAPEPAGYVRHPSDRWLDVQTLGNDELAAAIREQGLDLLVDLNAYSYVRRLPLWRQRIAPVNVAWFNMYATSGLPGFDCLIGDRHVYSADKADFFSEKVVALSHSYLTFRVLYETPEIGERERSPSTGLTLGCLAPMYKISDAVLAAWAEILHRVPSARLLVRNAMLDKESNRQFFEMRLQSAGVPRQQVEFRGSAPHHEFLETYAAIDLALDTFPYNGGSTTMEALWQGVPTCCIRGDRWAARISASLLREAGLGDFIADSPQDHIEQVVRLLVDPTTPSRLAECRQSMRRRLADSSVCDATEFAREIESVYRQLIAERDPQRILP